MITVRCSRTPPSPHLYDFAGDGVQHLRVGDKFGSLKYGQIYRLRAQHPVAECGCCEDTDKISGYLFEPVLPVYTVEEVVE
jgi:hypothetical protein